MKITVLTVTARSLYFPEQVKALRGQTLQDFEWVIVDDHLQEHKDTVARLVDDAFPLVHLQSNPTFPYFATARALNQGLIHSRGELIFFKLDYVLPQYNCLERHWEIYQKYKNVFISGRSVRVGFKPIVLEEGKTGKYPGWDYRMGLFDQIFSKSKIEDDLFEAHRDGIRNWWAARNDSAPLEALLDCNGFDERFDGGYGNTDADMAKRLMAYGLRYLLDYKSACLEFEHTSGDKPVLRSEEAQRKLEETITDPKVAKGVYTSGIDRNLREERGKCLAKLK